MAQDWQKTLPEAQGSIRVSSNKRVLWRSTPFTAPGISARVSVRGPYEVAAIARWDDECGNGSNTFYLRIEVVMAGTEKVSEYTGMDEVPNTIKDTIPAHLIAAQKFNGCHPFGPWYYIENTVYQAGDRDCWGLRKGERVQQIAAGGRKMWSQVAIDIETGEELPLYRLGTLRVGDCPTVKHRLEWRPCWRIGEGKARELDHARSTAIWPEATDEELSVSKEELIEKLKARLPGLLVEFRKTIEELGFQW